MAKIWFRAVQKGLKNIEDVPKKYIEDVQALLESEECKWIAQ